MLLSNKENICVFRCISQLLDYISTHPRGVRVDQLHLIGYSVGAHIAGLVANYLDPIRNGKIGRITGTIFSSYKFLNLYNII